jgi:fatty-acyl-CoA synthase
MNPASKGAAHVLRLTALIAVLPLLFIAAGAVGTKLGLWDWKFGFGTLSVGWASATAFMGVFAGLLAFYVAAFAGFRRLWPLVAVSLLLPLAVIWGFGALKAKAARYPGHDMATSWIPPLDFSPKVMAMRGPEANPVHPDPRSVWRNKAVENWTDRRAEVINAGICPGAKATRLGAEQAEVHAKVKAAMQEEGLEIVTDDVAGGRIEGVATSYWYEFKDDVVARISRDGGAWLVDLRSVSRVGGSDLGANCERVTAIAERLYPRRRQER